MSGYENLFTVAYKNFNVGVSDLALSKDEILNGRDGIVNLTRAQIRPMTLEEYDTGRFADVLLNNFDILDIDNIP